MDNFLEIETSVKRVFNSFRHEVDGILDRKLTGGEFRVLSLISSGVNRTTDLSKKLDVSASHITAITDSLVANNFITRHRSEVDRRIVVLELTEEAKDFVASIEQKKKRNDRPPFLGFYRRRTRAVSGVTEEVSGKLKS